MNSQNLGKNFISAVVYLNTAEDAEHAADFTKKLVQILKEHFLKYEIIFVDDDSLLEYIESVKTTVRENSFPISIPHRMLKGIWP